MAHERHCEELANELGYSLHMTSTFEAVYSKEHDGKWIFLEIYPDKFDKGKHKAKVSAVFNLSKLEVSEFSFPNKNFKIFERDITKVMDAVKAYETK